MRHIPIHALSLLPLFLGSFAPLVATSPSDAAPHRWTNRRAGAPGVERIGKIPRFSLQRYRVNNVRYVSNEGLKFVALTPKVYDAQTHRVSSLPFLNRISRQWDRAKLVYYDATTGMAGLWVTKRLDMHPGTSTCKCGGQYKQIPGTLLRYCPRCGTIVRFPTRRNRNREITYVHVNLKSKRILWTVKLGGAGLYPLGVDNAGEHFMAYRMERRKVAGRNTQKIELIRVDFNTRKIAWTYRVKLPSRKELEFRPLANATVVASDDLQKVFVREYDERNSSHPRGYLSSPPAQGVIVDVSSSSQVSFQVPLTSYGAVFDRKNRFLYVSSYQLGRVYKFDALSGRLIKSTYQGHGPFSLLLSKTGRYLYCVHLTGINAFDPVTLRRVKTIHLGTLFPGHRKLLSTAKVTALTSGDFFMGILKKNRNARSSSSKPSLGFVHFRALE